MKKLSTIILLFLFIFDISFAQNVNVDINLNMKHSVDGVSNFGRDRRMTIHSAPTESDWNGHEDMLDYLLNDLDVYFGRETGHATYWTHYTEEDPNNAGWPNETQMAEHGLGIKQWYETDQFKPRHQYESRSKNMIRGINDHCPAYPNLSWYEGFGKGANGWFVKDTDAAAAWISSYLETYYGIENDDIGEPLPKYWECYNEPDMNFMNPSFGMIVSSLEKNWEYHKLVAHEVRARLGDKAPLIGGMTWGQLDLYKQDGISSRSDGQFWYDNSSEEAGLLYDNMLSGVDKVGGVTHPGVGYDTWPKAWDNRTSAWWQWDYMYQGFIDYCGEDMDFYGVHMYDWPQADPNNDKANTRSGGHVEAFLDMFEWYDNHLFNEKKDIVLSEFGAVNGNLINGIQDGRRDWLYIKPFNQMMMQFLERPSHVVYSMPFAPVKAVWGAYESGGSVVRYQGATLMEPKGTWTSLSEDPSEGWGWSGIIHFFELWKDVEGTRIDTKSNDIDVQVDSYVDGNKVYLILNNCIDENKTVNLYTHGVSGNTLSNVEFRHIYKGDDDFTKYKVSKMTSAPEQVTLKPNSTIVLVYTYDSDIAITDESSETKFMSEPLAGNSLNARGTQLCHTVAKNSISATINGVNKPTTGEAIVRIGGFFSNPLDGTNGMRIKSLKVNDNDVIVAADNFVQPTRGYGKGSWQGAWFGVLEIECPIEYLNEGQNTIYFERYGNVQFTTLMIQAFDMTTQAERTTNGSIITALSFAEETKSIMQGQSLALVPTFTPADASDKSVTWSSSNISVASVDENGIVTAVANSGTTEITATSTVNSSISATALITAIPYQASEITSISIDEGESIIVDQYLNTKLNVTLTPTPEVEPNVIWTTSNSDIVDIISQGTVVGKTIGGTATITATVEGTDIKDEISVSVALPEGEYVSTRNLPDFLTPLNSYTFNIPVAIMGERTVQVELLQNGITIASAEEIVDAMGESSTMVTLSLETLPEIVSGYEIKLTLKDGIAIIDTKTKAIEMRAPIIVIGVSFSESSISIIKGATKQLNATVSPENASDKRVTWKSDNELAVTVDENGLLTAVEVGEAIITATSIDQNLSADITVTVSDFQGILVIEAEDFSATGGGYADGNGGGMNATTIGVNYVNTDDWAEYNIYVPQTGDYKATYYISCPNDNANLSVYVDGEFKTTDLIPNNGTGSWETYIPIEASSTINLAKGDRIFKIMASGSAWQWNLDRIELTGNFTVTSLNTSNSNQIVLFPNPVNSNLRVSGLNEGTYNLSIYMFNGMKVKEIKDFNSDNDMSVSDLKSGMYFLRIENENTKIQLKFNKIN